MDKAKRVKACHRMIVVGFMMTYNGLKKQQQ
jgi:hypothetical protein